MWLVLGLLKSSGLVVVIYMGGEMRALFQNEKHARRACTGGGDFTPCAPCNRPPSLFQGHARMQRAWVGEGWTRAHDVGRKNKYPPTRWEMPCGTPLTHWRRAAPALFCFLGSQGAAFCNNAQPVLHVPATLCCRYGSTLCSSS